MIRKLKHKISVGILLLAILLTASGSMVLYQFMLLNRSVNALIDDNYKTIQACQKMLDALEREDSGILLLCMGKWEEGRLIIHEADSFFAEAYYVVKGNLTETNEDRYVEEISTSYQAFKDKWKKPIVGTDKENNIEWYSQEINRGFQETKEKVYALMMLNQQGLYREASQLKERSYRAIMPCIIAIVALLIFALLFNFFLSQSLLTPLHKLISCTKSFQVNQQFSPKLKATDEFKDLENGIREVINRINRSQQKA